MGEIWADRYAGKAEAYGHLSDEEIAVKIRMLFRDTIEHEAIVVGARDRIARLARRIRDLEAERDQFKTMVQEMNGALAMYGIAAGALGCVAAAASSKIAQHDYEEIVKLARLFLLWFEKDGSPVDGFRFREQFRALADAVNLEEWRASLLPDSSSDDKEEAEETEG